MIGDCCKIQRSIYLHFTRLSLITKRQCHLATKGVVISIVWCYPHTKGPRIVRIDCMHMQIAKIGVFQFIEMTAANSLARYTAKILGVIDILWWQLGSTGNQCSHQAYENQFVIFNTHLKLSVKIYARAFTSLRIVFNNSVLDS